MNRAFDELSNLCDKILDDKYKLYEENIILQQENKQLKERINKAIEYIENHKRKDEFLELNEWGTRDLLKILRGEE